MKQDVNKYLQNFGGSFVPDFGLQGEAMDFGGDHWNWGWIADYIK